MLDWVGLVWVGLWWVELGWIGLGWVGLGSVGLEIGLGWGIGSDFIGLEALKRLEIGMPCTVRYPWHPAACGTQFLCIIGSVGQYATWYHSRQYFSFANSEKTLFCCSCCCRFLFWCFCWGWLRRRMSFSRFSSCCWCWRCTPTYGLLT